MSESTSHTDSRQQLRTLDKDFADWVSTKFTDPETDSSDDREVLNKIVRAVSFALHLKHTCLDLSTDENTDQPVYKGLQERVLDGLLAGLGIETIKDLSAVCCSEDDADNMATPLVRSKDGSLVWLQKYYLFERAVADRVRTLAAKTDALTDKQQEALSRLYPENGNVDNEDQGTAAKIALRHHFSVITGGPGTGKTWTVARIIALLRQGDPGLRIELAAPTGKAGNRMMESLGKALKEDEKLKGLLEESDLPEKAKTLHSLLGINRASPKSRHDRYRPLALDVLIIDEASMVDLPMMSRVLDALPEGARLILLGDKDQLASVEAGGVLAELCKTGKDSIYQSDDAPVAKLTTNHRSVQEIKNLADEINAGEKLGDDLLNNAIVRTNTFSDTDDFDWLKGAIEYFESVAAQIKTGVPVSEVLGRQTNFQILCALRNARIGAVGINQKLEKRFSREYRYDKQSWYSGLPVMITRNDHDRKLYNGDVGMVLPVSDEDGSWIIDEDCDLKACFLTGRTSENNTDKTVDPQEKTNREVKAISLAQMPPFEACYALSVHKSQGSEYEEVLLVLPESAEKVENNPVITKELLYTGVTRAKEKIKIWSGTGVLDIAVRKKTVRMSGLGKHEGSK